MTRDSFPGPFIERLFGVLSRVTRGEEMVGDLIEDARTRVAMENHTDGSSGMGLREAGAPGMTIRRVRTRNAPSEEVDYTR